MLKKIEDTDVASNLANVALEQILRKASAPHIRKLALAELIYRAQAQIDATQQSL